MKQRISSVLVLLMCGAPARSVEPPVKFQHHRIAVNSGVHNGRKEGTYVAFREVVQFPGAPWMRLHISEYDLGQGSFLILRPLGDANMAVRDVYQRLDTHSLPQWRNATALFNGDIVEIELHVAPGDTDVFVRFDEALEGEWDPPAQPRSLCGADSRVASTDNRVGRLYFGGCTAWRITTGAYLTAGHCVDFDPDDDATGCNPLLPDGVLDLSGFVEFNIPASTAGGATVAADPTDQYAVDTAPAFWRFDGGCQGLGKDWCVFGVFANATTGLFPHDAYGFPFRMTRENPANGNTIRITGCGSDTTGTQNFTLQTATGPYIDEDPGNVATDLEHEYQTDSTGGNSGSPIIWETNGLTVGIHTNAGCDNPVGVDGNHGTSFEVDALEEALKDWVDTTDTRFCDINHPLRVAESGTAYRPYSTVTLGITNVLNNGTVSIVAGSYTEAAGNIFTAGTGNKAMLLVAPVGDATIGN